LRPGTLVPINIEVPKKYPLSQDRIVDFESHLHSKIPMLYRPALYGNWNALSIARKQIPHANGSTHSCVAKSSGISAGPYISIILKLWNFPLWILLCGTFITVTLMGIYVLDWIKIHESFPYLLMMVLW
jgi:hypothetical protein